MGLKQRVCLEDELPKMWSELLGQSTSALSWKFFPESKQFKITLFIRYLIHFIYYHAIDIS